MLLLNATWEKWLYALPLLVSENSIQIHGILKFNFIWFLPQGHAGDVNPWADFSFGENVCFHSHNYSKESSGIVQKLCELAVCLHCMRSCGLLLQTAVCAIIGSSHFVLLCFVTLSYLLDVSQPIAGVHLAPNHTDWKCLQKRVQWHSTVIKLG